MLLNGSNMIKENCVHTAWENFIISNNLEHIGVNPNNRHLWQLKKSATRGRSQANLPKAATRRRSRANLPKSTTRGRSLRSPKKCSCWQVMPYRPPGGALNDDLRFAADHVYKAGGATCRPGGPNGPGGLEGWRHLVTMRPLAANFGTK